MSSLKNKQEGILVEKGKEEKREVLQHVGGISEEIGGVDPEADANLLRWSVGA